MIGEGGELLGTKIDIDNTRYEIDNNNLVEVLKPIYGEMVIEKRIFILIGKVQIGDNPQTYVLCAIINIRLSLNYL